MKRRIKSKKGKVTNKKAKLSDQETLRQAEDTKDPKGEIEEADSDDLDQISGLSQQNYASYGEDYDPESFNGIVIEDDRTPTQVQQGESGFTLTKEETGSEFMQWIIAPCSLDTFMNQIWEKIPIVITRPHLSNYFDGWFGMDDVKRLLAKRLKYTFNVDVRKYEGENVHYMNKNDDGSTEIADPEIVWRRFKQEGCSIRLLHPQRWCDPLHKMLAACERFWGCASGCNVYLTPPGTQGFPLHYDDIDAFILQLEGKKKWRVYAPLNRDALLPRNPPTTHFEPGSHGDPVLEIEIKPGDVLYIPRGVPHQAEACADEHSLHVTISTNQFNTWADFFEIAVPRALEVHQIQIYLFFPSIYFCFTTNIQ